MKTYRDKFLDDMQLAGYADRTRECYCREVRRLVEFCGGISPAKIGEEQVRAWMLYLKNDCKFASNSLRITYSGLKFFFTRTCPRSWPVLDLIHAGRECKPPAVLSVAEITRLFRAVRVPQLKAALRIIYLCGLRIGEAVALEVQDVDKDRMELCIQRGKGARRRLVPLPGVGLQILRDYWKLHRHERFIFPAVGRGNLISKAADKTIPLSTIQGGMKAALKDARIRKRDVRVHTLRHSYATHLLELGVPLKHVQHFLGHKNIKTTEIYCHITPTGLRDSLKLIEKFAERVDAG